MTTEQAINEIVECGYGQVQCHEETMRMAVDALRAQQWISVKDRLPETDGFYNVYMRGDIWGEPNVWDVTSCGFYDGKWDEDAATISHWMPLPQPPKEGKS